jgi:hypothetical protein
MRAAGGAGPSAGGGGAKVAALATRVRMGARADDAQRARARERDDVIGLALCNLRDTPPAALVPLSLSLRPSSSSPSPPPQQPPPQPPSPLLPQVRELRARVAAADGAAAAAAAAAKAAAGSRRTPPIPPSNPPYDAAAWRAAADELRAQPTLSDALRAVYEDVLALFPTAAQLWARWVELELSASPGAGGPDAAKRLFARCLVSCPTAELYGLYIKCIRRANEPRGVEALAETRAAFEHALSAAGQDAGAGPLWLEYLGWLQAPKPGTPEYLALFSTGLVGGDEDSERARAVR